MLSLKSVQGYSRGYETVETGRMQKMGGVQAARALYALQSHARTLLLPQHATRTAASQIDKKATATECAIL